MKKSIFTMAVMLILSVAVYADVTWVKADPAGSVQNWTGASMSADASLTAVSAYGNYIYVSKDAGATWAKKASALNWIGVAVDATRIVGVTENNQGLWISTNSGDTFTKYLPNKENPWYACVTIAPDGRIIAVGDGKLPKVYVSANNGATWTTIAMPGSFLGSRAVVATASKIYVTGDMDRVYEYNGSAWTLTDADNGEGNMSYSCLWTNGVNLYAASGNKSIYSALRKKNIATGAWGSVSSLIADSPQFRGIACSNDESKMYVSIHSNGVFVSEDSGITWKKYAPASITPPSYGKIACSADGMKAVVTSPCEYVYVGAVGSPLVTVNFTATTGGALNGQTKQVVPVGGSTEPVQAIPADGYSFNGWQEQVASKAKSMRDSGTELVNPIVVKDVRTSKTYVAGFLKNKIYYTIAFNAGVGGTVSGNVSQTIEENVSTTPVTAIADDKYVFAGWSDGSKDNPKTVVATANISLTANFIQNVFTVTFVAGTNGAIVSGIATQTIAYGGSTSPVSVMPNFGYNFAGWSGNYTGSANPLTITNVTSNMTVTANFTVAQPGDTFVVTNSNTDVIITFLVYDATYKYKLYLNNTNTLLFNNTEVGKVINLGKFAVGTELVFKLNVTTTGYSYYTGSASRNPDKIVHALVSKTSPTVWQFGFEDMYNGGDKDYNDCIFKLEGGVSTGKSAVARDSVADGSGKLTVLVKNGKALVKVVDMPMQYASYVAGSKDVQLNVGGNMIDFNNAKIVKLGKKRNAWKYVASVGTLIIDADKGLWKLDAVVENLTINNHVVEAMLFCEGNVVADNSSVVSEKDNGIVALLKSFAE